MTNRTYQPPKIEEVGKVADRTLANSFQTAGDGLTFTVPSPLGGQITVSGGS